VVNPGPTDVYCPRPGDIGLTQIADWGGRVIRLGQWLNGEGIADYQHAFVYIGQARSLNPDADMIVEAMPQGARQIRNWHDPARTRWLVCPDEYRSAVVASALGFIGVGYSFADYAALAAHRLHIPAPHLERYIRDSGHMICSQLADRAAAEGGWHLFKDGRWDGYVTPLSLNALWLSLPQGAAA
jgi:hypothetical protein